MSASSAEATFECRATPAQSALWAIHQMDPTAASSRVPLAYSIRGPLNAVALSAALDALVSRHGILRTVYVERRETVIQRVLPAVDFVLERSLPRSRPRSATVHERRALAAAFVALPFDLEHSPPIRARLWSCDAAGRDHLLVIVLHRIAADHTAVAIFAQELSWLYAALSNQRPLQLPDAPQFADYAAHCRDVVLPTSLSAGLNAWQRALVGHGGVIDLAAWNDTALAVRRPSSLMRNGRSDERSGVLQFAIAPSTMDAVRALAKTERVTPFTVMLGAFQTLLHLHTGRSDILLGVPFANRGTDESVERALGPFVNTLPVPVTVDAQRGFSALLSASAAGFAHAETFQSVPFDAIVERVKPPRAPGRNPLFQVGVAMDEASARLELEGVGCTDLNIHEQRAMLDMHWGLAASPDGGLRGTVFYDAARFQPSDVHTLMERYHLLLSDLLARPQEPLERFSVVTDAERVLLALWNDTVKGWTPGTLVELIAEHARTAPAAIAARARAGSLSYAELLARAQGLALLLRARGVRPGDLVGLCVARDLGMLVALLGIQMAGAAYVPLDPEYPDERLSYIARESGITALLVDPDAAPRVRERLTLHARCEVIALALNGAVQFHAPSPYHLARHAPQPDDIIYVTYTSGSTGRAKGVAVPHSAVLNFLRAMQRSPGFSRADRLLAVTTLSFDISVLELFLPLVCGGTLVIADHAQVHDGAALAALLDVHAITVLQATPGTWRLLLEAGWHGEPSRRIRALCGGEPLAPSLAAALRPCVAELWNLYGPTETTVWSTRERIQADGPITIGRPLENTTCDVLSPSGQELPPGIVGELVIGGAGVSAGYLHRPDLTDAHFVRQPDGRGTRYRTGDRAVRLSDGRLICLGRLDDQVKVNGHRVELGEIEHLMEEHPTVRQAAVRVSANEDGDIRLIAYVVPEAGKTLVGSELRRALSARVPSFMVPAIVLPISAIPLMPNGKRDRARLPDPLAIAPSVEQTAPRTPEEHAVAEVWRALLGVERVGVHDNFFEIGGTSLLAICAATRLREKLGVRPDPRTMFFQTLEQFAAALTGPADKARRA